jgi:hypothetical protein
MRKARQTVHMIRLFLLSAFWLALFPGPRGLAREPLLRGEQAAAEYLRWAQEAAAEGRWGEALAGLERAADYADLSSDLSYLLAEARLREGRPRGAVLEALRRGLEADRWKVYSAADARLLEAETLIVLRAFSEALGALSPAPPGVEAACLRLRALRGIPDMGGFRKAMQETLERYPRDPRPVRILFETLQGEGAVKRVPAGIDRDLVDTALRRLPLLLEEDGELAFLAAPFIADTAEARRLVAAYRVMEEPRAASLPAALELGHIGEGDALEELFHPWFGPSGSPPRLDLALLRSVWGLLRTGESRRQFTRNLSAFSGVIIEDRDRDGYAESEASYAGGQPVEYTLDEDQDGLAELTVYFSEGLPLRGEAAVLPENGGGDFAYPVRKEDKATALILWEQYPATDSVRLGDMTFIPRPREFFYAPFRLGQLLGSGLLYPEGDPRMPRISRRTLIALAFRVERPGRDFEGAVEQVEMNRGIPLRAVEILEGRLVSETEFLQGRPRLQRIDLDLDGRLETVRHFRGDLPPGEEYLRGDYGSIAEYAESDWDGDGIFETGEAYFPDGSVERSWDVDRDGIREYIESYAKD